MFANRIPRNAFDIRLKKASYGEYLDSISDFDWLHLQEQVGAVALATNTALALGRELLVKDFTAGLWIATAATIDDADSFTTVGTGGVRADDPAIVTGKTYTMRIKGTTTSTNFQILDFAGALVYKQILGAGAFDETFSFTAVDDGIFLRNFIAGTTDIDWPNTTIKQTDIAASRAFPGAELLDESGDGTADKNNWLAINGILTNAVPNELTVTSTGAGNPSARQTPVIEEGERYRVLATAESDGNSGPELAQVNPFVFLFSGSTAAGEQPVNLEFVATGEGIRVGGNTGTVGHFTKWRNLSVREASPMNLTNNGMAIGQPGAGNVPYIYLGDGATTGLEYDTIAEWNSKFNPDKLTMAIVVRVDDWGVGTGVIWRLAVDANTEIVLERRASELAWRYNVEGNFDEVTFDTATLPGGSPSEPFTMVMTVDTDGGGEIIGYMKGVASGTTTITGSWVGNFDPAECGVFAADAIQTASLDGGGADVGLGYRVWTPIEVAQFNIRSGL